MPEKCKDCCSRLFCMSVAEVNGEDFEAMANKKDCRKRVFTNADRIRAMGDEELAKECVRQFPMYLWPTEVRTIYFDFEKPNKNNAINAWIEWLKQPAEEERNG